VKSGRVNPELVAVIRDMSDLAGPSFVAEHLVLFQSVLKPSGAEYTPLFQGEFSPE
jgi:2'-5' RNA ligase